MIQASAYLTETAEFEPRQFLDYRGLSFPEGPSAMRGADDLHLPLFRVNPNLDYTIPLILVTLALNFRPRVPGRDHLEGNVGAGKV